MNNYNFKHGYYKQRIYCTWLNMKQRCYYVKGKSFKNYGGRGITVCEAWKNNFIAFLDWSLANGYNDNLTLDRKDVNGNYEPENCRWITNQKQQLNRRNNHNLTYQEVTKTLSEWSKETGLAQKTIENRLKSGWDIHETLFKPIQAKYKDLTGKKFGRIQILSFNSIHNGTYWNCICDCGNAKIIKGSSLVSGLTKSCGCIQKEFITNLRKSKSACY